MLINKKIIYIFLILSIALYSCKNDKSKVTPKAIEIKETPVATASKEVMDKLKLNNEKYIYIAKVNINTGIGLYSENSNNSEKIATIGYGTQLGVVSFTDKFETLPKAGRYDAFGKWVKVEYIKNNGELQSGYVFDDFLDYKFPKNFLPNRAEKDTLIVTNEKEFIDALASNRVILIDTDILNLEDFQETIDTDEYPIMGHEDSIDFFEETIYFIDSHGGMPYSVGFYGYHDLEFVGKDKMVDIIVDHNWIHVLDFNNCFNIVVDNLNFYHDAFEGSCEGEVLVFNNCSNFYFQNSHFDGSGTVGNDLTDCDDFNYLNCEYYRNSSLAFNTEKSGSISFVRCDFHDNDTYSILNVTSNDKTVSLDHCYISNNAVGGDLINVKNTELEINNTTISNNRIGENLIDFVKNEEESKSYFNNCAIINNTSLENKALFSVDYIGAYKFPLFELINTTIKNNVDFYHFTNNAEYIFKNENTIVTENGFDKTSDTIATKFNSRQINGETYINRDYQNLKIDNKLKTITYKDHLINGLYCINILNSQKTFLDFPLEKNYSSYLASGKIDSGLLEGVWDIKSLYYKYKNNYQLSYNNGVLNGPYKRMFSKNNSNLRTVEEGNYKSGKKDGSWVFYNKNSAPRKKTIFKNNVEVGPSQYYYQNGVLRENRTDINNKNGITKYYYLDGKLESEVVYKNGKIDIDKSTFYDTDGDKKQAVACEYYLLRDENKINVDLKSRKYKNKVCIYYSIGNIDLLGYQYYENGLKNGIERSFMEFDANRKNKDTIFFKRTDNMIVKNFKNDSINIQENSMLLYDANNKLKAVGHLEKNNIVKMYAYDGFQDEVTQYIELKKIGLDSKKNGKYRKYDMYGELLEEKEYKMDKEVK
jgi:antitoxin component YwqK of YwqJK toxin-antitoxin module